MTHGGPPKRFLDVEMALRWAYRDELPRQHATPRQSRTRERVWSPYTFPAGFPDASPSFRETVGGGPSGGYADGWSRDPGFPAALGGPHPDAVTIEDAVFNLTSWRGHGFGPDGDPAGLMFGMDLMAIDHVQAGIEAIGNMAAILACHARAGTRPKWTRERPEPFPDTGPNGKPKVLIDETFVEIFHKGRVKYVEASSLKTWPDNPITHTQAVPCPPVRKSLYRTGAYCPLVYRPRPASLVTERAEWAAWRMGLDLVHQALAGRLETVATLAPAAPWRPWAGEKEAHGSPPELFRGQRDEPYRRVTREQEAARRRALQRRRQVSDRAEAAQPTRSPAARRDAGANRARER